MSLMLMPPHMNTPKDCPAEPSKVRLMAPANPRFPYRFATCPETRATVDLSTLLMGSVMAKVPSSSMAFMRSLLASSSSSTQGPLECASCVRRCVLVLFSGTKVVRKDRSSSFVLVRFTSCFNKSLRPMISSIDVYPRAASDPRTSLATSMKKLTTSPGTPGMRARSSSRWLATPTGQLLVWQMRAMMQPVAIMATVPNPYSSAPISAAIMTSWPLLNPPSARSTTRSRSWFMVNVVCDSVSPISQGPPACLMLLMGDAPVPPSCPDTWMTSAPALATPEATVPMPASATSFTETLADGLIMCRS
mmetsp:Transcript_31683/g.53232  ORF Transcript_31683/g.53232 Transcript_31683/m.53232 type:complete len:305 (+) Transcript_31683:1062-1976(+)